MKYLKKFENNNQLCIEITFDEYQEAVFKRDLDEVDIETSLINWTRATRAFPLKIFSKMDVIKFNQRDKELLLKHGFEFFPKIKNDDHSQTQNPYFWKSELIASAIKKDSDTAILNTISINGGFTIINKTPDSWFYIHVVFYKSSRRNPGYINNYYKCDDIEGLSEFLKNK